MKFVTVNDTDITWFEVYKVYKNGTEKFLQGFEHMSNAIKCANEEKRDDLSPSQTECFEVRSCDGTTLWET